MSTAHRPPHRWTNLVLSMGTLTAGALFAVGMLLGVIEPDRGADAHHVSQLLDSLLALRPWGWSMLGVLVVLATPAAGLVATAIELRIAQPRAALMAMLVLGVLAIAVLIALA